MRYKLICFDMDGVIFKETNFWIKVHQALGTTKKGEELTKKYLHTNYQKLVEEVVQNLWKGKSAKPYFKLVQSLKYNKGVKEVFTLLKEKKVVTALVSASSIDVAQRAQKDFGIDHIYANELIIKNGKITWKFLFPIGAGGKKKAQIVQNLAQDLKIKLKEVIFIGDSETDIEAFREVGLAIAFNTTSAKVMIAADFIIGGNDLRAILPILNISS